MERVFRLALSGTPGTGKTTVASLFEKNGYDIISLESLAKEHNCLGEIDRLDNSRPIDIEKLCRELKKSWSKSPENTLIIGLSYDVNQMFYRKDWKVENIRKKKYVGMLNGN